MKLLNKTQLIIFCVVLEMLLIGAVSVANINPTPILYFLFYNLLYGVVLSFLLPVYLMRKGKENVASVGIKKLGIRQIIVLFAFVIFSVGGQLIPLLVAGEHIAWNVLPMGIVPLIMTTFFEEFLFRGFIQTRIEKRYGWLIAILVSGLMFSLYHLGYPGFRTFGDILLLFAVGIGFACAYKLSGNNLIVAYFVNLPNAFVTYILKFNQFPIMSTSSTIVAIITIVLIVAIVYIMLRLIGRKGDKLH
uniref:CPBP family intramembrane glutamic endopeptidase n=1 Tax=Agathobacter sp. TaxID=2021311 RepID=UPI004057967C